MTRYAHNLSPWERMAMRQLYKYPGSGLGPSRSKDSIGAQGLVRQGLATATGIPATYRLTDEGRAEHERRWPVEDTVA